MTHEFLYIPECPVALIGRDLLSKLRAQISFQENGQVLWALAEGPLSKRMEITFRRGCLKGAREMPFEVPGVWVEDNPPGLAVNIPPGVIERKPGVTPIRIRQYPILMRHISSLPEGLLNYGILRPCQSA
jgi:hypothetical protein